MFSGVFSNHADLAPNFAGTLMAVTNMVATVPGVVVPALVGEATLGRPGLAPWHAGPPGPHTLLPVFGLTSAVLVLEVLIFSIFAKADIQVQVFGLSAPPHTSF